MSDQQTLLQKSHSTYLELVAKAKSLVINSQDALEEASNTITIARRIATVVDKHRVEEKQPHLEAGKIVDEKHFAIIKPCKELADGLESKARAYRRQLEEEAEKQRREAQRKQFEAEQAAKAELERLEKERAKLAKKNEKKDLPPPPPVVAPVVPVFVPPPVEIPQTVGTQFGTVKLAPKYGYDIDNIALVPVHYLTVDDKRVKEAIKSGRLVIPGLKIYEV